MHTLPIYTGVGMLPAETTDHGVSQYLQEGILQNQQKMQVGNVGQGSKVR